jgi:putative DNA primase/helicase
LLSAPSVECALVDAARTCGLAEDDGERSVRNTIASGLKAGAAHPREIKGPAPGRTRERARTTATRDETVSEALDLDEGVITQDGVARVFANRYAGKLRFCHHTVAWFEWTGAHWKQDDTELAFQFARSLGREASAGAGPKDLKEVRKVAFASGVERFARGDRAVAVTSADWDQHAFLLGTPEGTVDLATGRLRPADPTEGITKVTRVAPAAAPSCPLWLRFLDETFDSDRELIRFVQQWCGYTLTGDVREHALVFGSGPGGNGKSVLVNTVSGILGDYAATAAMDTFTASRSDRHTTELAMLRGARMVTASETEEGRPWAESRIKQLTGGDWVTARFMREDNFTYRPTFKLTIIGNHQPELRNVDEAMRRRVNIVPFNCRPPSPDRELELKLKAEWPGILRWMIEGCLDWQRNGLVRPSAVADATADYFAEQDLFGQWLEQACDVEPANSAKLASSTELFKSWSDYAKAAGEAPGNTKNLASALRRKGIKKYRASSFRGYRGIQLVVPAHWSSDTSDTS